jgi:hypothetical protein
MIARPFHSRLDDLPRILPIFPLSGVLLLPDGRLPLNIFEPRYLAMVQDALGWGRLIGMIQPIGAVVTESVDPPIYDSGCAGRISQFAETEDGRILLTLTGVCRFRVEEEVDRARGYRRVAADWTPFHGDLDDVSEVMLDRPRLFAALKPFARLRGMDLNWKMVEAANDYALTVSLPMACPFEPSEKQALLECATPDRRGETLIALMEMAIAEGRGSPVRQ